jgi:hypothetical protein
MSRSALVFAAEKQVTSRFALVRMAAKGARALHRGERLRTYRIANTINEVLMRIAAPDICSAPPEDQGQDVLEEIL